MKHNVLWVHISFYFDFVTAEKKWVKMNSFVYFVLVVCAVGVICFIDFSELFWVSNFSSGCDCVADRQWYIA